MLETEPNAFSRYIFMRDVLMNAYTFMRDFWADGYTFMRDFRSCG